MFLDFEGQHEQTHAPAGVAHAGNGVRRAEESATVVIGGGFGGIAAALRLRAHGLRVTLLERQQRLGGRAQVYERDGFRFDAGPTVITAPWLFDELFSLFGRRREDYVEFLDVAPWYRIRFHDGSALDYGPDRAATEAGIRQLAPGDLAGYRRFAAHARRFFETGFEKLGDQPFHRFSTLLRHAPELLRLRADRSVYGLAAHCMRDERLRQAFSLQPLLVGGNPRTTTCIYSLIHELEHRGGVKFPRGGTGALVRALEKLLQEVGVEVRTGCTVSAIETRAGAVEGVRLEDGERIGAARVVADADPVHVHRRMLPGIRRRQWPERRLRRLRHAMGLYVLYFATTRRYEALAHHTILMGPDYAGELDAIFRKGRLVDTPSLYLHRPTASDPDAAPAGHDGFYVLAAVPNEAANIDWPSAGPALRERVLTRLEATLMPGLRRHLATAFDVSPPHFRTAYLSPLGSGFSLQPMFRQSAWFRFHNRSREVAGLYFVGAGTHPGAGLPGVVTSAKVVENCLAEEGALA